MTAAKEEGRRGGPVSEAVWWTFWTAGETAKKGVLVFVCVTTYERYEASDGLS